MDMYQKRKIRKEKIENSNQNEKFHKVVLNWYPGHMAKTKREIKEKIDLIDIVFEVVDARIPYSSKNKEMGRRLILDLNLTNVLGINNLSNIILCTDLIGIWCQLEVEDIYPFTKVEKEQILCLRELLKYDEIDNYLLYKYGLYLCTVYADIKGLSKRNLNKMQSELPIFTRRDIVIHGNDISKILGKEPGKYIKDIMDDIEKKILYNKLANTYDDIKGYVIDNYME